MPELNAAEPMPEPEECVAMTEADFKARFSDSAVLRTGLTRLQRNAAIALENRAAGRV